MSLFDTFSSPKKNKSSNTSSSLYSAFTSDKGLSSEKEIKKYTKTKQKEFDSYQIPSTNVKTALSNIPEPITIKPKTNYFQKAKDAVLDFKSGITDVSKKDVPIAGGITEAVDLGKIVLISQKIKKGQDITQTEREELKSYFDEQNDLAEKRKDVGYQVGEGLRNSATFMVELGLATAAAPGTAGTSFGALIAQKGAKKAIKETAKKLLAEKVVKDAVIKDLKQYGLKMATKGAVVVGSQQAIHTPAGTLERMIGTPQIGEGANSMDISFVDDGQELPEATLNAVTQNLVETGSEYSGGIFSFFGNKVKNQLVKAGILKTLLAKNPKLPKSAIAQIVEKAGWNGVIEEMGEEQIGNIAYGVLNSMGLSDQQFQVPTVKDLATQLVTFSIMGSTIKAVDKGYQKIVKQKIQKETSPKMKKVLNDIENDVNESLKTKAPEEVAKELSNEIGIDVQTANEIVQVIATPETEDIVDLSPDALQSELDSIISGIQTQAPIAENPFGKEYIMAGYAKDDTGAMQAKSRDKQKISVIKQEGDTFIAKRISKGEETSTIYKDSKEAVSTEREWLKTIEQELPVVEEKKQETIDIIKQPEKEVEVVEVENKKPQHILDIQDRIDDLKFDGDTSPYEHQVLSDLSKNLKDMTFNDFKGAIEMIRKSEVNNFIKEELTGIVKKYQDLSKNKPQLETKLKIKKEVTHKKIKEVGTTVKLQTRFQNTDAPTRENEIPVKNDFGKQTKKWLSAINEKLGWIADTDKKGKTISPHYNEGGIGIGGDVTGLFWKPGSEYGIYIMVSGDLIDDNRLQTLDILYRATRKDIKYTGYSNKYLTVDDSQSKSIEEIADIFKETVDSAIAREENKKEKVEPEKKQFIFEATNTEFGRSKLLKAGFGEEAMGFENNAHITNIDGIPAIAESWLDSKTLAGFSVAEQFRGKGVAKQYIKQLLKEMGGRLYVADPNEAMLGVLRSVGEVTIDTGTGTATVIDTDIINSTIKEYDGDQQKRISDTSDVPTTDGGERGEEATSEVSGYDRATMLAESGDGFGADRTPIEGVKGKKARQLINEQVEQLLEARDYSTNSSDYSQNDRDLMMLYTGAGGKESVGAEGAGLLNEYYTPFNVIDKMWEIVRRLNPQAKDAFEPSVGTGRIIERSPESIQVDGSEISKVSGTIASVLYPDSNIIIGDFQELFFNKKTNKHILPERQYDVVIGNPPFGDRGGFLKGKGEEPNIGRQEEYFITRGLDMVKDGGYLIYVVNSSFLKTGTSKGKLAISQRGYLELAYRLPEDSFEDTSIGTDIVVFKKLRPEQADLASVRVRSLTDDTYFNSTLGANNILGETRLRKNRFGQTESYVEGNLEDALNKLTLPEPKVIVEYKPQVIKVAKKTTEKKEVTEKKPRKQKGEVTSQIVKGQTNVEDKIIPKQSVSNKSDYSDIEIEMLKRIERDGSIPFPSADEMQFLNYFDGRYYNNTLYFAGEIYKKLEQLEVDKKNIIDQLGEAQYEKQKKGLESVIPTEIPLKDIAFDPIDRHIANFKTTVEDKEVSILNAFNKFIRYNDVALSPRVGKYDVLRYVQGERASKDSKPIMGAIKNDARRLFNQFIKNELDVETQNKLQKKFNVEKNGYVRPDFSSIPVEIKDMSKTFKGRDFRASGTQKDGISFLVNKGTGLIAYGVGVGKTHTLALATKANMDKGWTKRPLFIVPKSTITKTWIGTLKEMFPTVTINNLGGLQADVVRRLKKEKGENPKEWIKDGEISVISHEGILRLGFTEDELVEAALSIQDALWKPEKTKRGEEKKKNDLEEILGQSQKYVTDIMISDLGIDHISVDEVHNFRKVFQGAKQEKEDEGGGKKRYANVIGGTPSKRAQQLFLLSQYIQRKNKNRNVFLASATPFENHATEVYNILSFIARDRMKSMSIFNINDFFSTFANFEVELDRKLDGTWIDREKMKSFANLSSLQGLLREFIDYQEDPTLIRPDRIVLTPHLQMSEKQIENLARIQSLLRNEKPQKSTDEDYNMLYNEADDVKEEGAFLKASTYSIANSVSPYFIKEYNKQEPTKEELIENSPKIKYAIEVVKTVKNNPKTKGYGTFIYFGKAGVSYHPKIREYIIENLGYKSEEVAVLSGDITDEQKESIKDDFNKGVIKVLIGGDQTKEGIDLQENGFITLNLALGWNPTEVAQVEGRVWRQGNKRTIAPLIYPLVENSGDATIYNKFEEKGGRINDLFSYRGKVFDVGEIDPAEKKLALLTDPKDKANMQIEIDKTEAINERILLDNDKKELIRLDADRKQTIEEIADYTKYIENKQDRYGGSATENEIKEYKKELKLSKARLERLDLKLQSKNITNIDQEIDRIQAQILEADKKIKAVNDTYEEKLKFFTEKYKEDIKNRKPISEMMGDIENLIETVNERSQEEIDELKAQKIAELEAIKKQFDDIVEMPQFVVAEKEVMEDFIASDVALKKIRERARSKRESFEIKRGRDFLLAQLEKSKHRKLYAGVSLMLDNGTMTEQERAEAERKLALDIPIEDVEAVSFLVNSLPEVLFEELGTRITRTGSPTPGRYGFMGKVMEISTDLIMKDGGKYSRTIIHELWHHMSQYLPETDVVKIRQDYNKQKNNYIKENPWFEKYHVDNKGVEKRVSQKEMHEFEKEYPGISSRRFTPIIINNEVYYKPMYSADDYRFKNLDEWFAELMSDSSLEYIKNTNETTKSVWYHLKQILSIIKESIVRAFGFDRGGRILSDFMEGKNMDMVRNRSLEKNESSAMDFVKDAEELARTRREGMENMTENLKDYSINLRRKDLNFIDETLAQSRDLYLKDQVEFEAADKLMKVGDERRMKKEILDKKVADILKPYFSLNDKERGIVDKALIEGDIDSTEYGDLELSQRGFNSKQKEAYRAVRRAFNSAHVLLLNEMRANGVKEEEIAEFEKTRKGYIPHKWKYRFAIKKQRITEGEDPKDPKNWKTVSIDVFKTAREADKEFEKRRKDNKNLNIRYVNDTLDSLEVDFFTEQRFSFENMKSIIAKAKTGQDVKDELLSGLRNMIKEKGFGRHFIQRTGIAGYETKEIPMVIANYMTGLNGFITKMEAGKKYYDVLESIDARRQKRFYSWVRNSIAYDMGQSKEFNTLKEIGFIYYLANDLSFLLTNITQNLTIGIGELSKIPKGINKVYAGETALLKATADWAIGNLSASEKLAIKGLLSVGRLGGEMTAELMGFKNNPLYRTISNVFNKALYSSTTFVEQNVNRVPAFLAARRLLAQENPQLTEKEINERALEVSDDIHFRYGKQHRPEFMRGRKSVVFVFNHYIRSYLYQLSRDLKKKEFLAFSKKMFYTFLLGGSTALPFAKIVKMILDKILGDDDDEEVKKELGSMQLALERGVPASYLNVDLSNRIGIDVLTLSNSLEELNQSGKTLKEKAGAVLVGLTGALGNLFLDRLPKGIELLSDARYLEAFGKLSPDFIGNPLKAYQGSEYGVFSQAGNALKDEEGEPFKYTTLEGFIKATGYTPTREQLAWDEQSRQWRIKAEKAEKSAEIREKIDDAIKDKNFNLAKLIEKQGKEADILGEKDYVSKAIKDETIKQSIQKWNSGAKNQDVLDRMEREIALKTYGKEYTTSQLTTVTQEFGFRRYFGYEDKIANDIYSASSNKEKVELLRKARQQMGVEKFREFYNKGRKTVQYESGRTGYVLISDSVKELYFKNAK